MSAPAGFNPSQSMLPEVQADIVAAQGGGGLQQGGAKDANFLQILFKPFLDILNKGDKISIKKDGTIGLLPTDDSDEVKDDPSEEKEEEEFGSSRKGKPKTSLKIKIDENCYKNSDWKKTGKYELDVIKTTMNAAGAAVAGTMEPNEYRLSVLFDTLEQLSGGNLQKETQVAIDNLQGWHDRNNRPEIRNKIEVYQGDWGVIAGRLIALYGQKYAVLNMANAEKPGGGYERGAGAQEENMLRRTSGHFFLLQDTMQKGKGWTSYELDKTDPNKTYLYKKETTDLINGKGGTVYFKPDCPLVCIKGPEKLMPDTTNTDQTTSYALLDKKDIFPFWELRAAAQRVNGSVEFNREEAKNRIKAQFKTLKDNGFEHVILGAFGCGAFNNPPKEVAQLYKDVIESAAYKNSFKHIVFPIYLDADKTKGEANLTAFQEKFPYFQNQEGDGCGRHAINNLLQGTYCIKKDSISDGITDFESFATPIPMKQVCILFDKKAKEKKISLGDDALCLTDSENYEAPVLEATLRILGHTVVRIDTGVILAADSSTTLDKSSIYKDYIDSVPDTLLGFIINTGLKTIKGYSDTKHWVALKKTTTGFDHYDSVEGKKSYVASLGEYLRSTDTFDTGGKLAKRVWRMVLRVSPYSSYIDPVLSLSAIQKVDTDLSKLHSTKDQALEIIISKFNINLEMLELFSIAIKFGPLESLDTFIEHSENLNKIDITNREKFLKEHRYSMLLPAINDLLISITESTSPIIAVNEYLPTDNSITEYSTNGYITWPYFFTNTKINDAGKITEITENKEKEVRVFVKNEEGTAIERIITLAIGDIIEYTDNDNNKVRGTITEFIGTPGILTYLTDRSSYGQLTGIQIDIEGTPNTKTTLPQDIDIRSITKITL